MPKKVHLDTSYDLIAKRYVASCPDPTCGRQFLRAKREAALHALAQHVSYDHGYEYEIVKS